MHLTMDLINVIHFYICEVITTGYFTKHFDTSKFGQDGGILILDLGKWEHLEVRFCQSQLSQD